MDVNKVYCVDVLKGLKKLDDESVDLVFADPPFNLNKDYGIDKDNRDDYFGWCDAWICECFRVLKKTGSFYLMNYPKNIFDLGLIMRKYGFFKNMIIWKQTKPPTKNYFVIGYQPILFFTKEARDYVFNRYAETKKPETDGVIYGYNKECVLTDIWTDIKLVSGGCLASKEAILRKDSKSKIHPCQMPEKLIKRIILFSSNEGDLVLDPFIGSGTTAVVCKRFGRDFIGFDNNPKYVDLTNKRLEQEVLI